MSWQRLSLVCFALALTACGSPAADPDNQPSEGPSAEVGQGWEEIVAIASGSEVKFDVTGHYTSSRGLCSYNREFGQVQPLDVANTLMHNTNLALQRPFRTEEYCLPGKDLKYLTSYVDLMVTKTDKRPLFIPRNGEVCTKIQDQKVARDLMSALDQSLGVALKEGCDPSDPRRPR